VIIAAGYDTRAYRLASPGVSFYEIDLPHASKKKQELVAEHMPKDKVGCPRTRGGGWVGDMEHQSEVWHFFSTWLALAYLVWS
jgi:hypothetical protein